jgi:hypothetical protein
MADTKPIEFNKLVVMYNPASSNADVAKKIIARLQKAYPGKVVVGQVSLSETTDVDFLKQNLGPRDILAIAGGDGTICSVSSYLFHPGLKPLLGDVRVLAIGTGRMNDLARMLGGRYFASPLRVLTAGFELPVYPLRCICTPLDAGAPPLETLIFYNMGFGYSADVALYCNTPEFRAKQQARSPIARKAEFLRVGARLLNDARYFDITLNGERRAALDVTAACGHIFGGFYRLPSRLSQPEFFFEVSDDKSLPKSLRTFAELLTNRYSGGQLITDARFTLHEPVIGQNGGEAFSPPTPCEIHITTAAQPLIMLSTNPKA